MTIWKAVWILAVLVWAVPTLILFAAGDWDSAREASVPAAALLAGWALRGLHEDAR